MGALGASTGNFADATTDAAEQTAPADSIRVGKAARVEAPQTGDVPRPAAPPEPSLGTRARGHAPERAARVAPAEQPEELSDALDLWFRGTAARRLLKVLVERAPARLTWGQVATLAGLKARGGYFNSGVRALRGTGLVTGTGAHVWASELAIAEAGIVRERRQTPAEVLAMWAEKLPAPAPAMLRRLALNGETTLAELAELLELQPRGGFWNKGIAMLRNNNLVEIRGGVVRLAAELR
jgi:uncharacterized protein